MLTQKASTGSANSQTESAKSWRNCSFCKEPTTFSSSRDFLSHLRLQHCRKEGGSYICTYGPNSICQYLPLEGVCDSDYTHHINKCHITYSEAASDISSHSKSHVNLLASDSISERDSSLSTGNGAAGDVMVKQKPKKWTVYDARVNLAALLNDPRPGKRQPDFFIKTWGTGWDYLDLSPLHELPEITPQHFSRYKRTVIPRLSQHQKILENPPNNSIPIDTFPALYTRSQDKASGDLEKVPSIYHSANFELSDERLFHKIFPWADIENSKSKSKRLLQEKLSHYLDMIEVEIARQVALRSEAFFHVLTSHDDLQCRLSDSVKSITTLRTQCKHIQDRMVKCPLEILVKTRKTQRLRLISRKLNLMMTLHQTQPTVQQLLTSNDFVGALDVIATAQEVLKKELSGITSFRHLGSQLSELEKVIRQMAHEEFMSFVTKYVNHSPTEQESLIDEDRFTAIFLGLIRIKSSSFVDIYRNEASAAIKAQVKLTVINYVSAAEDRAGPGVESNSLGDQMRSLNYNSWLLLMDDIFSTLNILLIRIKALVSLMVQLTDQAAGLSRASSDLTEEVTDLADDITHSIQSENIVLQAIVTKDYRDQIHKELRDLLAKVCENACERCAKVVNARSKDMYIEKLSPREFFTLTSSVEKFVKSCDEICGSRLVNNSLRGCLQGYSIRFINKFHEERKNTLNLMLDHERWRVSEVPRNLQALLTHCELCEQLTLSDNVSAEGGAPLPTVTVYGQSYTTIGTALALLKMILEYCSCVEDSPKSASDVLTRLIELIKLFNSRSSQLVLGAGALQTAGLKTISVKNLALLERSLQLILVYIPLIRDYFHVYVADSRPPVLRHIEPIIQEYKQHVQVVQDKIIELATSMIDSCVSQWEIRAPVPSVCFRTLCKQINKFHEAVCDVLDSHRLQALFNEVNTTLKTKLRDRLKVLGVHLLTGPQQGLIMSDLAYFSQNAGSLTSSSSSIRLSLVLNDIIVSR